MPGRHLVFAEDAGGCPIILDSEGGSVSSFFFKGGDWEPIAPSMEKFLQDLFVENPAPGDWEEYVAYFQRRA